MSAMASQITRLTIVYSTVYPGADQRKHQSSASLAFVGGIHRWPVNSPHKGPVTRKMFPFDDVIMVNRVKRHYIPVMIPTKIVMIPFIFFELAYRYGFFLPAHYAIIIYHHGHSIVLILFKTVSIMVIESDKTTSIYNVSTRVLSKK